MAGGPDSSTGRPIDRRTRAGTAVKQDDRGPFVEALQRAREAAYAPGEYVEQESFMRAAEIRALAERAGITPGVSCSTCAAGSPGPGGSSRGSWAARYLGVDSSASAIDIARERAGGLTCRFAVAEVPPLPPGEFDVVLLLETMLAFPDKQTLLGRSPGRFPPAGGSRSRWRRGCRSPRRSERACPTPTRSGSPRWRRCTRCCSGPG